MKRREILILGAAAGIPVAAWATAIPVTMYKNPDCGCCDRWAQHLEQNGFQVETINTDLAAIKRKYDIPPNLEGCHTALIGNYLVEGLIPARYIKRMLAERPSVRGLSLPGMPVGAPGMPGTQAGPLNIYAFTADAAPQVFATF